MGFPLALMANDFAGTTSEIKKIVSLSVVDEIPFPMSSLKDYFTAPTILENNDPSDGIIDDVNIILSQFSEATVLKPKHKSYVESSVFVKPTKKGSYEVVICQKWNRKNEQQLVITYGICTEKQLNMIKLKLDL